MSVVTPEKNESNQEERNTKNEEQPIYDLTKFKLTSILNSNSNRKSICILGYFIDRSETDLAIIILEKTAIVEEQLHSGDNGYFGIKSHLKKAFINDIYGNFECFPSVNLTGVKTTIIYPATQKHIDKFRVQNIHIVQETAELYRTITLPHLEASQFSLEWVYNILNHKQEADRILYEDPDKNIGFILLPDLKWDGKTIETLYLLAIVHHINLKSIRDLNATHLPLLRNIRDRGVIAIKEKFNINRSQLRIYFHYQPSFYHLHVHFTYLKYDAPGIFCEKSHLLDTVIGNIELLSNYYQKISLSFVLLENDKLLEKYRKFAGQAISSEKEINDGNKNVLNKDDGNDENDPKRKKPKYMVNDLVETPLK